jgi:indoleamine 2,3-dioxygenase
MDRNDIDDSIRSILIEHDVDPARGFLPSVDPLHRLPDEFESWERLAEHLPAHIAQQQVLDAVRSLPPLDTGALDDEPMLRRAMLLLSIFGNACVWSGTEPALTLPAALCTPWAEISTRLQRPMIIAHASIVLHNWTMVNPELGFQPDNLRMLASFGGSPDEEWFYMVTVAIEACGARALPRLLTGMSAASSDDADMLARSLEAVGDVIEAMTGELERMEERCRHDVFYQHIRPYLTGWPEPGVVYEGVSSTPEVLHGGSAAQSSLLNAIDAGLDIPHEHPGTSSFLQAMRRYMPPRHRRFIEHLESGPSIRDAAARHPATRAKFDRCIEALTHFRRTHQAITMRYITQQAPTTDDAIGTGGTDYADFLRRTRLETSDRTLDDS